MFARVIHGSRYSISLAIVISLVSLLISSILGGISGYYGGTLDNMLYIGEENIKALNDDIRTFLRGEDPSKAVSKS